MNKHPIAKRLRNKVTFLFSASLVLIAYLLGTGNMWLALAYGVGVFAGILMLSWTWQIDTIEKADLLNKVAQEAVKAQLTKMVTDRANQKQQVRH